MQFGFGLVLFDLDKDNLNFSIRVRAQRFSPDMFYVNEFADRLRLRDAEVFFPEAIRLNVRRKVCKPITKRIVSEVLSQFIVY